MSKVNFFLRTIIQFFFYCCSHIICISRWHERRRFTRVQQNLHQKWRLKSFRIGSYEDQYPGLLAVYNDLDQSRRWVKTSGTKNVPKQIPYDRKRLKDLQQEFMKGMITLTSNYSGHKTFFAMASLDEDHSLTSGMINQQDPSHIELIQAPYRYLQTQAGRELRALLGDLAARVSLLIVTQPRFVYATNPSTISHFLKLYESELPKLKVCIQTLLRSKDVLEKLLKLSDGPAHERLSFFAHSENHPPVRIIFPKLQAFITWQGGYVAPFLEQIKEKLPLVDQIPMYSMSTEVIETLPHRIAGKLAFLPTAQGVVYEFLDDSGELHLPHKLLKGGVYTLIVSDEWGLQRYDTQDLFIVKDIIDGLPDLQFLKRRGLTISLTGEKLTEEQVQILKEKLIGHMAEARRWSLSLYPVKQGRELGHELTVIGTHSEHVRPQITEFLKEELLKINSELKSKIESGRLAQVKIVFRTEAEFAEMMGKERDWESQFKILPLYDKIIERT